MGHLGRCARKAGAHAPRHTDACPLPACSPTGYFRTANPIAKGPAGAKVAMCSACEGCAADKCGANGCTACAVAGWALGDHPTLKTLAGTAVKVCRPAGGPTVRGSLGWGKGVGGIAEHAYAAWRARARWPAFHATLTSHTLRPLPLQAFAGRATLPASAVWPASEFGGAGGGLVGPQGQFSVLFYDSATGTDINVASW